MFKMTDEEAEHRHTLDILQSMIDTSADRLEGLRTKCATTNELTQQEIRTIEGKIIKLFSSQLTTKAKLREISVSNDLRNLPSVQQWLQVVGLCPESIQAICCKIKSIEALQDKSEYELKMLLGCDHSFVRQEEFRRLNRALHNLKRYTEILAKGGESENEPPLYWDSWDSAAVSPRQQRSRVARCSVPSEDHPPLSPPATPPSTPPVLKNKGLSDRSKVPSTPPAKKKHQTGVLIPDSHPLTKSKSHESQLANKVDGENNNTECASNERRGRLATEPGPGRTSPLTSSPLKSPPGDSHDSSYKSNSLQVPKSPRTPTITRGMGHVISHRFAKTFKMVTTCDYCDKQMFLGTGLKCKECKYKCHRDCESKVPPSCGLPRELVDEFRRTLQTEVFLPNQSPRPSPSHHAPGHHSRRDRNKAPNVPPFPGGPDSSSNTSSCNSSTPSSPALVMGGHTPAAVPRHQQFHFPDVVTLDTHPLDRSQDSDKTVSGSVSTDSDRTPVRVDSQDSQVSDGDAQDKDRLWPRQNSLLSNKEWDIPFDELQIGEAIGTGHFGTVYRGNWHGDVAIKVLNMNCLDDEKTLENFRVDVDNFKKTRHEHLLLFMGACMNPPHLAIVTSMCKGLTLYHHIHIYKDKFAMNKTISVAQQIAHGMGYLHSRGLLHKDLKTKNIFLQNGKVIITDFGLFSVTKLCFGNRKGDDGLSIPPGWLCYLAPEIIRSLKAHQEPEDNDLPFSEATDVYAFGTVWYELLCGEWPFKGQPPEAIIWQVGKGMKQTLANLQASRDVKVSINDIPMLEASPFHEEARDSRRDKQGQKKQKNALPYKQLKDILMMCWAYKATERPDFVCLQDTLEKLPKKRLARSPSHPIHLSRSAESVF